jgi:DNA-binding response OmpR family regulator
MTRILIVDDNRLTTVTSKKVLVKNGFVVDGVLSAKKALELLEERYYDIILTDINMPNFTGIDFLAEIQQKRSTYKNEEMKICVMSGDSSSETILAAMELGASDYILKPAESGWLVNKMFEISGERIDKKFAHVGVGDAEFSLKDIRIQPELKIKWLSELQLVFTSSAKFEVGQVFQFNMPILNQVVEIESESLILKITDQMALKSDLYHITSEFVGIPEYDLKKIRSYTVKGERIVAEVDKKLA